MSPAAGKIRLSILLSQYDRAKHANSLYRLIETLSRLSVADACTLVLDNALPGDWVHEVTPRLIHLGGDNSHREFSAFDRGLSYLADSGRQTDVLVLATDAFLAYGEEFLGLITDDVVRCCCHRRSAWGWVDSYMEECRIGELSYDSWLRSSFVFLPWSAVDSITPLAADLEPLRLFSGDPERPFRPDARISDNLKGFLVEWLTGKPRAGRRLEEVWHSRVELTEETLPLFEVKTCAILREHLLSARLDRAGVPCYDYRCLERLARRGAVHGLLAGDARPEWQWLGWQQISEPRDRSPQPGPDSPGYAPTFVLPLHALGDGGDAAATFLARRVMPLVLQRHSAARLLVLKKRGGLRPHGLSHLPWVLPQNADTLEEDGLRQALAILLPPLASPVDPRKLELPALDGLRIVTSRRSTQVRAPGSDCFFAESPVEFADVCCRLIESADRLHAQARRTL